MHRLYIAVVGEVTKQDVPLAVVIHRRAALDGFAQSMHELGVIFYTGTLMRCDVRLPCHVVA